jgi:hypothetical protein
MNDLDALTAMLRILTRGRPGSAKLGDLADLHSRFAHLEPFTARFPQSTKSVDRRLRLAADLNGWLPTDAAELHAARLLDDAPGRVLVARALTDSRSLEVLRRALPSTWDTNATKIDWTLDEARSYLHRACEAIAAYLVSDKSAALPAEAAVPTSEAAQFAVLSAINTVRLEGRCVVTRSWLRRVEITTDEQVRTTVTRRGADGFEVDVVDPIGCTLVRRTPISMHTFRFELELPKGLRKGQTHIFSYGMRDTNPGRVTNRFLASAGDANDSPHELIVRVQFDPADLPSRVWMIEGLEFATLPDDPDLHPVCELRGSYAEAIFRNTIPYRMYAICWQWDE